MYQNSITCDIVDMYACHVLLGRPWQFDVDTTYGSKKNVYFFVWKNKIILPPILHFVKTIGAQETKFLSICNKDEFLMESKETK